MAAMPQQWQPPAWTLGDRMRKARLAAGLEQEELAVRLGVSRVAVSKWERDAGQPRRQLDVLRKWAEVTQVPIGWLLGLESASGYKQSPQLRLVPAPIAEPSEKDAGGRNR